MRRILIVDDNAAIRESLADALADEGFQVEAVSNGVDALGAVSRHPPELILLDLMMPGIGGAGVVQSLTQQGCRSPIIVMSADRRAEERARALGVAGCLSKPFDLETLLALIHQVLARLPATA